MTYLEQDRKKHPSSIGQSTQQPETKLISVDLRTGVGRSFLRELMSAITVFLPTAGNSSTQPGITKIASTFGLCRSIIVFRLSELRQKKAMTVT